MGDTITNKGVYKRRAEAPAVNATLRRVASVATPARILPLLLALAILVFLYFHAAHFFSQRNILNILVQTSSLALLAIGMTFVMVGGGIDLSMPATMAFGAVLGAFLMRSRRQSGARQPRDAARRGRDRARERHGGGGVPHDAFRRHAGQHDRGRRGHGVDDQLGQRLEFPRRLLRLLPRAAVRRAGDGDHPRRGHDHRLGRDVLHHLRPLALRGRRERARRAGRPHPDAARAVHDLSRLRAARRADRGAA